MREKFIFYYGVMGSGKTRKIFSYRYDEISKDRNVIIIKPTKDKKGDVKIVSRDGEEIEVDFLISNKDNIYEMISEHLLYYNLDTIFVDEVQFLTKKHIEELKNISYIFNKKVICFGLLTDFKGNLFEGSKSLIENGCELIELKKKCEMNMCDNRASFNARFVNDEFVLDGEQVLIDGIEASYRALCGECYDKLKKKYLCKKK